MNYEKLIAEIVTRVIEKLEALEREKAPCASSSHVPERERETPRAEVRLEKRVITEKDIVEARRGGASAVRIAERAIMTDLAKEYAHAPDIAVNRG